MPRYAKKDKEAVVAEEIQPTEVAGTKIELGATQSAMGPNLSEIIAKVIMPKHPDKAIKFVWKDDVRLKNLGWEMLSIVDGGDDVKVVKTAEEAEKTTSNILCWRDMKIEKLFKDDEEKRRKLFNQFQRDEENPDIQAKALNQMYGRDGMTFVPDKSV